MALSPDVITLMDPLHLAIALGPISVYLLLLGVINISRRPFVTNGARDAAALGIGIAGLVIAGPMELFLPEATAFRLGAFVWGLLLVLYALCVTLCVLLMRPRIVIYNVRGEVMRPILANLVSDLDREARWAGECLVLPKLGIQLHIEAYDPLRIVQLVAAGPRQSYDGWRRLERGLVPALRHTSGSRSPLGFCLVGLGVLLVTIVMLCMVVDPPAVAQSLREMLRL